MSDTHHDAQHARIIALEATVDRFSREMPAALARIEQLQAALIEALDDASSGENSMTVARFSELLALAAGEVTP